MESFTATAELHKAVNASQLDVHWTWYSLDVLSFIALLHRAA